MALVLNSDLDGKALAEKIAAVAAGKQHRLAPYQVDGRHEVTPAAADSILRYLDRCPDKRSEETIAAPVAAAPPQDQRRLRISDIPAGFYATPSRTGNNDLDFWKVIERKGGFRLVKRVIGGGTDKAPALLEIPQQQQAPALSAILRTGLEEAERLFHTSTGRCLSCGAMLTDEESRAIGRGPICRNK